MDSSFMSEEMNTVNMGNTLSLTLLQLVYLLDNAMEELILRAADGPEVNTLVLAKEKVVEMWKSYDARKES